MLRLLVPAGTSKPGLGMDHCEDCALYWVPGSFSDTQMKTVEQAVSTPLYSLESIDTHVGFSWTHMSALFSAFLTFPVVDEDSLSDVKTDYSAVVSLPILLMIVGVSGIANRNPDLLMRLAYVPGTSLRSGLFTLVSYAFVHGGLVHILSNLYFFYLFSANVERVIGASAYLVFFGAAAAATALLHGLSSPLPVIGCSGVVTAFMVYFVCAYPKAVIKFGSATMSSMEWIKVPAYVWLIIWLVEQFVLLIQEVQGLTTVSAGGHLGGALTGLIFYYFVYPPPKKRGSSV